MKRAVLCVPNPHDYIDKLDEYSIMIINPEAPDARKQYLLDHADWSLKITSHEELWRDGGDYANERVFWYTSGTTGDSKFYGFSQQQVDIMARRIAASYDLGPNDRYVGIMPLWHAHGQGFYWGTRLMGCETHFVDLKNLRHMSKYSPTFVTAIPDFLKVVAGQKFDNLRFLRSASAPLPNKLFADLQERYQVPVIEAFGMTEALSHCFTNPLHGEQRMGTVGLPDGIEARIDQDSRLWIRGPCMCQPDWYDTGDLAQQDEKGYFKIVGRSKDQINVRGIKINPTSLENQLQAGIGDIGDCVIFGTDTVKCLYTGDCSKKNIADFLLGRGSHCKPRLIQRVDQIPISPSGKISRSWLDQQFRQR